LLLDVRESEELFVTGANAPVGAGQQLALEDACCDVSAGAFSFKANSKTYSGTVTFSGKTERYELDIPEMDTDFTNKVPDLKPGIVRYLNHHQSFRVIPETAGSFYTLGAFYTPIIQFGSRYDDDKIGLLKVLHPFACLESTGSERGMACLTNRSGWDARSLFSIVALLGVGHGMEAEFGDPDIVVCDDLGTEAADFILGYTKEKRVIFIHCKGKGNNGSHGEYSASALQDVCGQATKNLRYFSRFGSDVPPKAKDWATKDWSAAGISGSVKKRIRKGPAGRNGKELWGDIQTIIRDPYAELEVWLFLGRMLKKCEFEKQLTKAQPAPEAQQAAFLLFSTMNDVASVGGRLKVYCSP
jgi:hypothetical protein